jgi:hypothetical protein
MTEQGKSKIENFDSKMTELFSDDERLDVLLVLEKTNRGIDPKKLVFAGLSDVAAQTFCSMKAVLGARESERMFFDAYLSDRLRYANKLGLLGSWPQSDLEFLKAGGDVTYEQVEALQKSRYGTQSLPDETSEILPIEIEFEDPDADYATRGDVFEQFCAEKYHQFRWNFPYGRYVFLGIPDGITNDFVYEFKSGSKGRFRPERTTEATVQGDLYGYFYRKKMKRVHVYTSDDRRIVSHNSFVDEGNAVKYLKNFARVDAGEMPKLPSPGKCRSCDFKDTCPLYLSGAQRPRIFPAGS